MYPKSHLTKNDLEIKGATLLAIMILALKTLVIMVLWGGVTPKSRCMSCYSKMAHNDITNHEIQNRPNVMDF